MECEKTSGQGDSAITRTDELGASLEQQQDIEETGSVEKRLSELSVSELGGGQGAQSLDKNGEGGEEDEEEPSPAISTPGIVL